MNIDNLTKINEVFTPSTPITAKNNLFGRESEVHGLIEAVVEPGRHVAVYGERGVGKTSIVNVTKQILKAKKIVESVTTYTCSETDSFADIIAYFLRETDQLYEKRISKIKRTQKMNAEAKILIAKGGLTSSNEETSDISPLLASKITPYDIASKHFSGKHLFVIDEFDRIKDTATRSALASTIKAASDISAKNKLVIVGVGNTARDLVGAHPSTIRCLATVKVEKMTHDAIRSILERGFASLGLVVSKEIIGLISTISCGMPYFAHLMGNELSKLAYTKAQHEIGIRDFAPALKAALDQIIHVLREDFEDIVAINSLSTHPYSSGRESGSIEREMILLSAALYDEVTMATLEESCNDILDIKLGITGQLPAKVRDEAFGAIYECSRPNIEIIEEIIFSGDLDNYIAIESRGDYTVVKYKNPLLRGYSLLRLTHFLGVEQFCDSETDKANIGLQADRRLT